MEAYQRSSVQGAAKGRKRGGKGVHSPTPVGRTVRSTGFRANLFVKRSEVGVDLTIFDESSADAPPTCYTFQPDKRSVSMLVTLHG